MNEHPHARPWHMAYRLAAVALATTLAACGAVSVPKASSGTCGSCAANQTCSAAGACVAAADTQAPGVPGGLNATAASSSAINLTWQASTDNVGVTGYGVYRNGTLVAEVASTSYQSTGLAASTAYSFTVDAKDAAGNRSAKSAAASATTLAASTGSKKAPLFLVSGPRFSTYSDMPAEDGWGTWLASNGGWTGIGNGDWLPYNPELKDLPQDQKLAQWYDLALPLYLEGADPNANLREIIAGQHDAEYRNAVAAWKDFGIRKAFVRIGWEADIHDVDAGLYKQAWNRLVPIIRSAGQTNGLHLLMSWSMCHAESTSFLPDLDKVDLFAPDIYLACWSQTNVTEQQVIACVNASLAFLENLGAQYHKPIGLGETAVVRKDKPQGTWDTRGSGDSYAVINDTIGALIRRVAGTDHAFAYLSYYNIEAGGVEILLTSQPNTRRALADLMHETRAW